MNIVEVFLSSLPEKKIKKRFSFAYDMRLSRKYSLWWDDMLMQKYLSSLNWMRKKGNFLFLLNILMKNFVFSFEPNKKKSSFCASTFLWFCYVELKYHQISEKLLGSFFFCRQLFMNFLWTCEISKHSTKNKQ